MNEDIIQQAMTKLQGVIGECIVKGVEEGNIGDLNKTFTKEWLKIGCEILKDMYEKIEEGIYQENKKEHRYDVIKIDKKTLITSMGEVSFKRRLYKNKKSGKNMYLFDRIMKIRKNARYTIDAEWKALEEVVETSYRRGGISASLTTPLSKVTVMNMLKKLEVKSEENTKNKKKEVEYLYIDADEDHIALQRETKLNEINKLIYVYEGKRTEAPKSKRKMLINPYYFAKICKKEGDNSRLWEEVYNYVLKTYEVDKIKMIYINGDGASWIKNGVNYFKKAKFIMDKFHITEYINKMTNHLKDSKEEAKAEIYKILYKHDEKGYEKFIEKLYCTSTSETTMKNITDSDTYFRNNFESICLRFSGDENVIGCSAEGHVSHILASRMSSRPMGWTIDGANKLTQLRLYKMNGGDIYSLVKTNDLMRQSATFSSSREENIKVYSAKEIFSDINKKTHSEYKYIEHYHAELTDLGKKIFAINNIKI